MTLHRLPSSSGLLASKGAATPLGLRKVAIGEVEDEPAVDARTAAEPPTQLTPVSDLEDGEAAASLGEPPPPASLLPFALHRKRPERGEAWELVSPDLLERLSRAAGKDCPEEAAAGQVPEPEPQGVSAGSQKPDEPEEVSLPRLGDPESGPLSDPASESVETQAAQETQTADGTPEARPVAPVADPAWRVGTDRMPVTGHSGMVHWLGWGAAAILLVGGIGWWSFNAQAPAPGREAGNTGLEAVESAAVQGETGPEPAEPGESAVESPAQSPFPGPAAQKSSATAGPGEAPGEPRAPSVDLVRIETNGDAVIAGRAAPNSELILLDNGTPIGSIKADAFGEWVFVPDEPLPQGAHEFGLVLKAVQGKVSIPAEPKKTPKAKDSGGTPAGPAPPSEAVPAPGDGAKVREDTNSLLAPLPSRKPAARRESPVVAPIPGRKPDFASEPSSQSSSVSPSSADFVVQLASVKTRDGARREWRKLQSRFPKALSGMNLNLHEAKLSRQGTVIRVRTGPFPGFSEAVDFCAQIRTGRQDCLVVRIKGGN